MTERRGQRRRVFKLHIRRIIIVVTFCCEYRLIFPKHLPACMWHCVLWVCTVKRVFISAQTQTVTVPVKGRWLVARQLSGVDTTTRCGTGCMRLSDVQIFFSVALIRIQIHIPWKHLEYFNNESSPYYFSELPAFTSSHAFSNQTCCHGQKMSFCLDRLDCGHFVLITGTHPW